MRIVNASYEILRPAPIDGLGELRHLELCARTAYKSEDRITPDGESAKKMIRHLIKAGHESTLEHGGMTVRFTVDRGVSHEIVRHRLASYTQESTRYCNYASGKFGNSITFIKPCFLDDRKDSFGYYDDDKMLDWWNACQDMEEYYKAMIDNGATPQEARSVLPNSLKTEVIMTANWREWRHFLRLRAARDAHPQIREVAVPLLSELHDKIPVLFDDIYDAIFGAKVE